jgi:outer membrane protein insertion porin family
MGSIRQKYHAVKTCFRAACVTSGISFYILTMLLFIAADAAPLPTNTQPDISQKIGGIEITGLISISESELLYLLDLKEGETIDRSRIRAGIKRAFLKGIFDDIIVETSGARGDALKIIIKEKPVISSIDIAGNNHISYRLLSKAFSVKKRHRYNAAAIEKTARDMNEIIRKKGFPESKVSFSVVQAGSNRVSVIFLVNEGPALLVRDLKISGDTETISKHLSVRIGDVFDKDLIDKAGEKIRADLKDRDFVGSRLTHSYGNGVLTISLTKGSRLDVSFEGNSHIGAGTLKKEVPFFELDSFSYDLLEETVRRIVALYHKEGYSDIQIAPIVSQSKDSLSVKFYINEGIRYHVGKVAFEGVTLPADRLKALLTLQTGEDYNPDLLAPDAETIREFYRALGYIYAEAKEPVVDINNDNASIVFGFREGIQVKIAKINIVDNKAIPADKILKEIPLKKGAPYNETDMLNSKIRMLDLYHKIGFLEAAINIQREISGKEAVITFNIREGAKSRFGKTVVIGNEDTRRVVITRALKHKEEEPFNNSILLSERQTLYRTGIFSGIDIQPADRIGQQRDVLYRIEEGDAGAVEFGVGYAEYEKFRGFIDISHRNLFGMNREVAFRTELSTLTRRFILSYSEPWFFNESLSFKVQLMKEYRKELNIDTQDVTYRLDRHVALAGVEKKLSAKLKANVYYELTQVKTYDVSPDIVLTKEDTGTLIISAIKAGLIYDTRDNPFEPHKGLLAGFTYKLASAAFLSETNFGKAQAYVNVYQALSKDLVFAGSVRGGYANSFDKNANLPLVERFFLGGRTTVRGYDQDMLGPKGSDNNPTGGNIFLMGNAEFRLHIWKGFGLVLFVDAGNVWQNSNDVDPKTIKYTTGAGLRYNTPVGPIRVDYGYKLTRRPGEDAGAVHFSVGHAF